MIWWNRRLRYRYLHRICISTTKGIRVGKARHLDFPYWTCSSSIMARRGQKVTWRILPLHQTLNLNRRRRTGSPIGRRNAQRSIRRWCGGSSHPPFLQTLWIGKLKYRSIYVKLNILQSGSMLSVHLILFNTFPSRPNFSLCRSF